MEGPENPPDQTDYVSNYQMQLSFPAIVLAAASSESGLASTIGDESESTAASATTASRKPKTSNELVQMRLLEAGLQFETPVSLGETVERLNHFCEDLERTGCFNSVKVEIGGETVTTDSNGQQVARNRLQVSLDEKDWYRLHLGGGIKAQELLQGAELVESSQGPLPIAAEMAASAGIRNLSGCLDQSSIAYRLDTKGITSWTLLHERPFYTFLPSPFRELLLTTPTGSRISLTTKAALDTQDFEYSRSYREYQRKLSLQLSNQHSLPDNPLATAMTPELYTSLSWSLLLRDIVPRRQVESPWLSAASPSILKEAGPSLKHSITALLRTNGTFVREGAPLNPTDGWQAYAEAELALPPGDVNFAKVQTGAACHVPLGSTLSLHWLGQVGLLRPLLLDTSLTKALGRTPRPPIVSDRFHMGGPLQLPGFLPAGIGPRDTRANTTDSLTPGGDSVGGDLYYRTSVQASVPALTSLLPDGRAFLFLAAGTCVQRSSLRAHDPVTALFQSTRASVGVGFCTTALAGSRLEVTYAWPLRFAPVDARRNFQMGIGVSVG